MTMLAPRSFLFTRQQSSQSSKSKGTKHDRPSNGRRTKSPADQENKNMSTTTTETVSRPTTPSSPVIIPMRGHRDVSHERQRTHTRKEHSQNGKKHSERSERRARTIHSPDAIPPSVAALLAITSIPPQKLNNNVRSRSGAGQKLTVDAILQHTGVSEKELSMSLGKGPLEFLLSPPDGLDDDLTESENGKESLLSTRTMSSESMPSLDDESISEASPSLGTLTTPSYRGRRSLPLRRMQSLSSPPGSNVSEDHPLSRSEMDVDELDFKVFANPPDKTEEKSGIEIESPRHKSAFKSNLTASLRAFRSAAKSFSTLTTPMIMPDDFLTSSIISIDPQVPFTDERMPPRLEDTPTPALRRYLNPTTNAPIEAHVPSSLTQTMSATKCTASIQMQTYKVSRSAKGTSPSVISRRTQPTPEDLFTDVAVGPLARQRDMRENSDFIRIAVMEMEMRRRGKLDDQKPGRAKWVLPPRKPATKPYEIGENGVPVRWTSVTH